jgi:hypothetical protein
MPRRISKLWPVDAAGLPNRTDHFTFFNLIATRDGVFSAWA